MVKCRTVQRHLRSSYKPRSSTKSILTKLAKKYQNIRLKITRTRLGLLELHLQLLDLLTKLADDPSVRILIHNRLVYNPLRSVRVSIFNPYFNRLF